MYSQYLSPSVSQEDFSSAYLGSISLQNEIEAIRLFLLDVAENYSFVLRLEDEADKAEGKILLQNRFVELTKVLQTLISTQSKVVDSAVFAVALRRVVEQCVDKMRSEEILDAASVLRLENYLNDELELSRDANYGTGLLPSGETFDNIIAGMDDTIPACIEDAQSEIFDQASEYKSNGFHHEE